MMIMAIDVLSNAGEVKRKHVKLLLP